MHPQRWGPGLASRVFKRRHQLYDATLLQVLDKNGTVVPIFPHAFQRNPASRVFDFLNEETSLWEEVQLMAGGPKHIFAWVWGEGGEGGEDSFLDGHLTQFG